VNLYCLFLLRGSARLGGGLSFFASKSKFGSKSRPDSDPDFDFDRQTILKLPAGYSTSGCAEKVGNQRLTASLRTLRTCLLCAREGIPFDTPPDADFFSGINSQPSLRPLLFVVYEKPFVIIENPAAPFSGTSATYAR
jgi:hypothetical protein